MNNQNTVKVTVSFELDIVVSEWSATGRSGDIAAEVQRHAENVVRGLFADMGWIEE